MSIRSITDLAVERDATKHLEPVAAGTGRRRGSAGAAAGHETLGDVVLSAVPTEIVGLYTAAVALVQPLIQGSAGSYLPLRWSLFAVFLVLTPVSVCAIYLRKRASTSERRRFPGAELLSSTVAFAAWGLVLPGSALSAQVAPHLLAVVLGLITIGAAFFLSVISGRPLQFGSQTEADKATSPGRAASSRPPVVNAARSVRTT